MRFGAHDRDAGLNRVSSVTRWLAAAALALVGALSALVAQALPGTSGAAATPPATSGQSPAAAPAASPSTTTTTDPGLQPAPAPVPTHHRSVAQSGAS